MRRRNVSRSPGRPSTPATVRRPSASCRRRRNSTRCPRPAVRPSLSFPSLPAGSPDRRVARPCPHHRPSGNRRDPRPARARRRAPGGASRHTPAPAPTVPGRAWDGLPEIPSALACLGDAASQLTDECCRFSGPFCKGLAVILPGDFSGPVLPEWGFIYMAVWLCGPLPPHLHPQIRPRPLMK